MSRKQEFHDQTGQPTAEQWTEGKRTFIYTPPDHPLNTAGDHVLSVHEGDRALGNIHWDDTGRVDWVGIAEHEQRKGHGSALWQAGQSLADRNPSVPRPIHSETQTPAGEKWAKKVGGEQKTEPVKLSGGWKIVDITDG